jgi:hypothetical protein
MVRKESSPKLGGEGSGVVEVDEMYHGGRRKNESGRMLGGDAANKTMVMGGCRAQGRTDRGADRPTVDGCCCCWLRIGQLAIWL